jgi:hypothetical protein
MMVKDTINEVFHLRNTWLLVIRLAKHGSMPTCTPWVNRRVRIAKRFGNVNAKAVRLAIRYLVIFT